MSFQFSKMAHVLFLMAYLVTHVIVARCYISVDNKVIDYKLTTDGLLSEHTFKENSNATEIIIDNRELKRLSPNCLKNLPNLVNFTLINTQITELPPDFFDGNKKLTDIKMQSNKLNKMPTKIPPSTVSMDLSDNKISHWTNFGDAPNLQILNLSNNAIVTLNNTLNAPELHTLDLRTNLISHIGLHTLEGMENLEKLYLNDNSFPLLPLPEAFAKNVKLKTISLGENTFACKCSDEKLCKSAVFLKDKIPDKQNMKCDDKMEYPLYMICQKDIEKYRKKMEQAIWKNVFWLVLLVLVFGIVLYLCIRFGYKCIEVCLESVHPEKETVPENTKELVPVLADSAIELEALITKRI